MDSRSLVRAFEHHHVDVLLVSDALELATMTGRRSFGSASFELATTPAVAVDRVHRQHFDVVVVGEGTDWGAVKSLISHARGAGVGAVIVQGGGIGHIAHLRALLAGADSYAPADDEEWQFDPEILTAVRPNRRIEVMLRSTLEKYGVGVPGEMFASIAGRSESADVASDVDSVIRLAAGDQPGNIADSLTSAALPGIRQLLADTSARELEVPAAPMEEEGNLYWNVRFPEHPDILGQDPHRVKVETVYEFETAIESEAGPDGTADELDASQLKGKLVTFMLVAAGGKFKAPDADDWRSSALSEPLLCSDKGTPTFRVDYRPSAGEEHPRIEAAVIMAGGSIANRVIELEVDGVAERQAPTDAAPLLLPAVARDEAPGAAAMLDFSTESAVLYEGPEHSLHAEWRGNQVETATAVTANNAYRDLCNLTKQFPMGSGLSLIGSDGDRALVHLATVGSRLYRTLFKDWGAGQHVPSEMDDMATRLHALGDVKDPPQLQILATRYPVPWGIIYDGDPPADDAKAADIRVDRFWGMRFDIYRHLNPSGLPSRRGSKCRVKPVVGAAVPEHQSQRLFVDSLRNGVPGAQPDVLPTVGTQTELLDWAGKDETNDLLYFFCHAVPSGRALGFGQQDTDPDRVTIDQLSESWGTPRSRNPVVIVNACGSSHGDVANGAPFVKFFTTVWKAQVFIGTDWPIQAKLADEVGKRILDEICGANRSTLRAALRNVITDAAKQNNYFPLMYAVHGNSNVQFADNQAGRRPMRSPSGV